jgi:hypothetical protein
MGGVKYHVIGATDTVEYKRPPSLNSGVLTTGPDGSEPGAKVFISGTLRCSGPYERGTVSATGFAVSGTPFRPLSRAETDALVLEWVASRQSRAHGWLRYWATHPSAAPRISTRAVTWLVLGVAGVGAWGAAFSIGMQQVLRMRRGQRALYNNLRGLCPACGYSLKGNEAGPCPECGADAAEKVAQARRAMGPPGS